jgi:hypothetical protein
VRKDVLSLSAHRSRLVEATGVIEPGAPHDHRASLGLHRPRAHDGHWSAAESSPPCTSHRVIAQVIPTDEVLEEALALCAFAIERWAEPPRVRSSV